MADQNLNATRFTNTDAFHTQIIKGHSYFPPPIVLIANTSSNTEFLSVWFERINEIVNTLNINSTAYTSNAYVTPTYAQNNYIMTTMTQQGYATFVLDNLTSNVAFQAAMTLKEANTTFDSSLTGKLGNTYVVANFVKISYIHANYEYKVSANTSYAKKSANLTDLSNTSVALTNLGQGTLGQFFVNVANSSMARTLIGYPGY